MSPFQNSKKKHVVDFGVSGSQGGTEVTISMDEKFQGRFSIKNCQGHYKETCFWLDKIR